MISDILAELDDVASTLEARGFKRLAARTDMVTNTLEVLNKRLASRKPKSRKAKTGLGGDEGLSMGSTSTDGPPPGSSEADEAGHDDAYIADNYHRVPVGKDSMSRMLGTPSVADMLDRLDFADEGRINIQSSKRRTAKEDGNFDEGDPLDPWSTLGLPESGNEDAEPPVDKNQVGDVLPFLGTVEEGELHMPEGSSGGSEAEIDRILEEAEEQDVTSEPGMMGRESSRQLDAHRILQSHAGREAADVKVADPEELLNHKNDPQENVLVQYPWVDGENDTQPVASNPGKEETPGVYASRRARRNQSSFQ